MLVTINDKKLATDDGNGEVAWYEADVVTANDYYPFGMIMPGRKLPESENHRHGFNGQERSAEIDPNGNNMTAEFWQYDARLGRRWNVDPKTNISFSPYICFLGNPLYNSDPFGDTTFVRILTNGTYEVTGGNLAGKDNGIYLRDEKGKVGDLVGYSATPESFYNSDIDQWMGTINPNDQSGRNFLNNEIVKGNPALEYYMLNATAGGKYDFKRSNARNSSDPLYEDPVNFYRGMPILDKKMANKYMHQLEILEILQQD